MIQITRRLNDEQWKKLVEANKLLWDLTDGHCHMCKCEFCEARMLTDIQDGENNPAERTITFIPEGTEDN